MNDQQKVLTKGPIQGLLPWQVLFVFVLAGLMCIRWPGPGLGAVLIFAFLVRRCSGTALPRVSCLVMALAGAGAAWTGLQIHGSETPDWTLDMKPVQVRAVVEEVRPKPEKRLQLILRDAACTVPGQNRQERLPGKMVLTWQEPLFQPSPGQVLSGQLKVKPVHGFVNPGTWDSQFTWLTQGVRFRAFAKADKGAIACTGSQGVLQELRQRLRQEILLRTPPGTGRGLLLALLMGDRSELTYADLDKVRRASLAHILAQSGLHLGFVASLAWLAVLGAGRLCPGIYLRLPRRKLTVLLAAPLVLAYLWLGDFRPSLTRAALMFFFWGVLLFQGRPQVLTDGLFFALAVIIVLNPLAVFDIGLQMSILAVAGIILVWPTVSDILAQVAPSGRWGGVFKAVGGLLGISLIANLVLLPLMVWNFGQVSPHLYMNLIWLPVIGWFALPAGLFALICSLVPGLEAISNSLFHLASFSLSGLMQGLNILDSHGALQVMVPLRPRWPELMGFWLILGVSAVWWKRPKDLPLSSVALGLGLLLCPGLVREWSLTFDRVGVKAVDVGQGQAMLIEWGQGRRMLVDGGGSWNRDFDLGRFALAPALTWGRAPRVDTVILSHSDFDHLRGLYYILEHFSVREFLYNGNWPSGWDGQRLTAALDRRGVPARPLKAGEALHLQPGLRLEVLHPTAPSRIKRKNNRSLILRLANRDRGLALFPGDAENEALEELMRGPTGLQAELLVVPHHGSKSSLLPAFYREVDPALAVVSCGFLNIFRFPHPRVAGALQDQGIQLLSTAEQGMIEVDWDLKREGMQVRTAIRRQRAEDSPAVGQVEGRGLRVDG